MNQSKHITDNNTHKAENEEVRNEKKNSTSNLLFPNKKNSHLSTSSSQIKETLSVIISGGGTGGHIFPAIAIANALRANYPNVQILFVGAERRMEMEKVPAAGYNIVGLPVSGLQRKFTWRNLMLPFKLVKSMCYATRIVGNFRPDVVIGVGGYASAPTLWAAQRKKIPTLLQEQNSYAGITNKLLAKRASIICVAYDGMERFFPKGKIILTGNPVRFSRAERSESGKVENKKRLSSLAFHFSTQRTLNSQLPIQKEKTVLVVGGSLGSGTLNSFMQTLFDYIRQTNDGKSFPSIERGKNKDATYSISTLEKALSLCSDTAVHFIWQTGKRYYEQIKQLIENEKLKSEKEFSNLNFKLTIVPFIERMDEAFSVADVVVSRAGAGTISELCAAGKACIFVPSPNVAENHQTKNAQALVAKNAAIMVTDADTQEKLLPAVFNLLLDNDKIRQLENNIATLAKPNAANDIVEQIVKLASCG